jgi:hypothetical protein
LIDFAWGKLCRNAANVAGQKGVFCSRRGTLRFHVEQRENFYFLLSMLSAVCFFRELAKVEEEKIFVSAWNAKQAEWSHC